MRIRGLFAAFLISVSIPAPAQQLEKIKIAEVEKLLSSYIAKNGIPGLSAAIALDGKVVWSNGYGFANLENFVPAKATTVYRSASIGKTITATAAMRLVHQGKLDLEAPIQRSCPAFPVKPWALTARHLLSHTSGIRHYGGPRDVEEQTSTRHYANVVGALAPFQSDPLLFEPGTKYSYSTYGYNVLGCVIEGAAGIPFLHYLRSQIFQPAGMTQTRDDDPVALIPNRAAGYVRVNGELRNATHVDVSNRLPAGGYATTAQDVASFAAAFLDGKLVPPATVTAMLTPQKTKSGETIAYGLGWGLNPDEDWYGEEEAFHGGSSPGASGMLYAIPRRRFTVVFLTNLEGAPDRLQTAADIAKAVLDLGAKPKSPL